MSGCNLRSFAVLLAVLPATACGSDDPGDDAPSGPRDVGELKRVDWRTMRAAALETTTITAPTADLFALSDEGFVTRSACQDMLGCTYTWHDRAGVAGTRRDRMANVTNSVVSPDGTRGLLVALSEMMAGCNDGELLHLVARGTLQLLDLATGEASFELALRSNVWSAPAFTPGSDWFFAAPIAGDACLASNTSVRSIATPFGPPPGLDDNADLVQVVDDKRWLAFRGAELGLVDPQAAGSFRVLGEAPERFEATGGWIHVYLGFGEVAQDVVSLPPGGGTRQTTLRDEDWFPFGSWGRWIRVCQALRDGYRDCRVADAQGEVAPVELRVTIAADHSDDAVLLGDGAIVFVGPTEDGGRAVYRIDLFSGKRELLHAGDGTLRPLGDGAAALLLQGGGAWLIESHHEQLVASQVASVLTSLRLPGRAPVRQDELAVIIISPDPTHYTLAALDLRTRRVATLTDDAYISRPGGLVVIDDDCGQPWTTRHGGAVVEGFAQDPGSLYFVEKGAPATLWVLPVDLSAPPRQLSELADPRGCHAPLASPDGRVGFAQDVDASSMRITVAPGS